MRNEAFTSDQNNRRKKKGGIEKINNMDCIEMKKANVCPESPLGTDSIALETLAYK